MQTVVARTAAIGKRRDRPDVFGSAFGMGRGNLDMRKMDLEADHKNWFA